MAEGEFALVRQHIEDALTRTGAWVGDHDLYAMLADASARHSDAAALQRYAPLADEAARRYDHSLYRAIVHRAWGVLHRLARDYDEATDRLAQALAGFQALDAPWQVGCTWFELGELHLARGEPSAAAEEFLRALAAFEAMGAVPDVARTRGRLQALNWRGGLP